MRLTSDWLVPAGLVFLSFAPIAAGSFRLMQLVGGAVTAENARFFGAPLPAVSHIVTVTLFGLLGALQFAPHLRRTYPRWHRWSGRIVVPAGLMAALSGLWMSQFYALPPTDGMALYLTRLVVGVWMVFALCRGYAAIRRRDVATHRAWMLRGYTVGMGAGTQVLTNVPFILVFGMPDTSTRAILLGAGWAINAGLAEAIIYRRARPAALAAA